METIETVDDPGPGDRPSAANTPAHGRPSRRPFQKFPDDSKLNEMRADLTTQAADFVRTLRTAQDLEQKDEIGSSLAWYLKAQKIYPDSEFAQDGIQPACQKGAARSLRSGSSPQFRASVCLNRGSSQSDPPIRLEQARCRQVGGRMDRAAAIPRAWAARYFLPAWLEAHPHRGLRPQQHATRPGYVTPSAARCAR